MKKKEMEKIKEMSMGEMVDELKKLRTSLATVRHELAMGKSNKSASVQNVKRDIAQIKLIVHNMHPVEKNVPEKVLKEKISKGGKNG